MATILGTDNSEVINGLNGVTNGPDVIYGYGGNDLISAAGGNDMIFGGAGADTIYGGAGTDTSNYIDSFEGVVVNLATGQGYNGTAEGDYLSGIENVSGSDHSDVLIGDGASNVLAGFAGDDGLYGGGGDDYLYGGEGDDTLKGGGGADTLHGGYGVDTVSYGDSSAGVFIFLAEHIASNGDAEGDQLISIEAIIGSAFADDIWGNPGANILSGGGGNDWVKGYGGQDWLNGGTGNDVIDGGEGFDFLTGGDGADRLIGGLGADTFVYKGVNEFADSATELDLIEDFEVGVDKIDLSAIDANSIAGGNQAFSFVPEFTGVAGQLRVGTTIVDGSEFMYVSVDVDGNPDTDHVFLVDTNGQALTANDFIL